MNPIPFTHTNESVTVIFEGRPHTIQKGATQFHILKEAIFKEDWDQVVRCLSIAGALQQFLAEDGRWTVANDRTISLDGLAVPTSIQQRIWSLANQGMSPSPLFRFYERLAKNPSHRSVNQLFDFMTHVGIPLEADGRFLAYKAVNQDYTDVHTGTVDNTPGVINQMQRNLISDDPQHACHFGYHVGALAYAQGFHSGGQMIICRVDPEHVVCVPHDSSHQKMRVCEYEVVGNYSGVPLSSTVHDDDLESDTAGHWTGHDRSASDDDEDEDDEEDGDLHESSDTDDEVAEAEAQFIADDNGNHNPDDANEPDLRNNQAQSSDAIVRKLKKITNTARKNKAGKFRRMDAKKLMDQSITDLRLYAGHTLKIVGASKIPGGKGALISKILKLRKK